MLAWHAERVAEFAWCVSGKKAWSCSAEMTTSRTAILPCRTSAQTCEITATSVPKWCSKAARWASLPVVQSVRGVADLITRTPPHNTQRAFLRHRLPLSSPQDIQRCCHPV